MTTAELYRELLNELDRSLVVDDKTRGYWLKNYQTLPEAVVKFFYDELKKTNRHIDEMIAAGIDGNPEMNAQIRQKMKEAKKKLNTFREQESQSEENPEEFLKSNL